MADREFLLKIVGDVSSAQKSIGTLEKDVSGFKSTAATMGKAIVGAIAVDQVVQAGKAVVNAASDQEQAIGALHSVFGDYSADMDAFGETTAKNLGISRAEFSQLAAVTGSQLKNAGVPMEEVATSTQAMTERAADLAAMYGGTVPEAMAAMSSALKGEMDPMEKYAVTLKASSIEAKAVEMGLTDAEGKVTDYGKAMATQALIMEQSSDAAGTFAKESGSLAGQQAIMSAQMKDTQAQIGTALMPTIVKLTGVLKELLNFVSNNIDWLLPLAAGILGVVVAIKAWQMAQTAWSAATKVATAVQWLFNAAMTANPIGLIVIAVVALIAAFVLLYTKVDWFRELVDKAVDAILAAFQWLWDWVSDNWPLLLAILTGPIGAAVLVITKNWDTIKDGVKAAFDWVKQNWPLLLAILTGPIGLAVLTISKNWTAIKDGARALVDGVKSALSAITDIITYPFREGARLAKSALQTIIDAVSGIYGKIQSAIKGVAELIQYPFKIAFDAVKQMWNNTVGGFGFSIPSWVPKVGGKSFKIPEMAKGGIVTKPTIALIGEAGPEAVVPLSKGGGMGSVTINVYALAATPEVGRKVWEALRAYERQSGKLPI